MNRRGKTFANLRCTQSHAVRKNRAVTQIAQFAKLEGCASNGSIVIFALPMKDIPRNDNKKDMIMTCVSMWITLWKRWIYRHKINLNRQLFQLKRKVGAQQEFAGKL